ncbi:MAG: cation:proton antiporter, partial [Rubricella sp.]
AFLLGGSLKADTLRGHGREIVALSLVVTIVSVGIVAGGLLLLGASFTLALVMGAIAAATAPAATRDVVRQSGRTGPFATTILGIVAIDDAWGLIAFSLALALAAGFNGGAHLDALGLGLWEIGGAAALGLLIGFPAAQLTGRLKPGEPTLIEAIGVVLLCAGLAMMLEVSFLLTGMVCGVVVVNVARHHDQPFHEIERIEWPFVLLFFVMAGASLELHMLQEIGVIGLGYIILRAVSRMIGGIAGAPLAGVSTRQGALTGLALMPQAGVAIGMALVAADRFPQYGERILAITIASTIVFEILGPLCTQVALARSEPAETGHPKPSGETP